MTWEVKKLGEVCEFKNGHAHEKQIVENGKYIVINSKYISSDGEIFKTTDKALSPLFKGDIVFVMSDVPNGKALAKCFLVDKDDTYTLNQRIGVIRSNNFDKMFLFYQLNRHKYLLSFNNGENQTNLRKNDILNCELLIPPPPEQKHIVAILDEAFENIARAKESAEKNLKNANEIFESYLQSVFKNKGEGWEEKTLGEVCEIKPPKREARNKLKETDFVSFAPMKCLEVGQKNLIPAEERTLKEVGGSYTYFANDDVLLAKITPCFENGKLGIAKNLKNGVGFGSSEYIVFRTNDDLLSEYLYYFLLRSKFRDEGTKRMMGAVGHKRVSKEFIEDSIIPFPSFSKQQSIVAKLDAISADTKKLEAVYEKKLADLEELKKSILQKAFNGELTEA